MQIIIMIVYYITLGYNEWQQYLQAFYFYLQIQKLYKIITKPRHDDEVVRRPQLFVLSVRCKCIKKEGL